jgi:palmitoyl-protein thioesterase
MYNILAITAALFTTASSFVLYPEAFIQDPVPHHPNLTPTPSSPSDDDTPLPVVIWHGLGDSSTADGLKDVATLIDTIHPGTYTYIIQLGTDGNSDRSASFFGNVSLQVESVCAQLAADPILSTAPAIDAVGFSQGGQFLRAYVQKCNWPPVRNLITFGSQHNGIREFQKCKSAFDIVCQGANALLRSGGVWSKYVQSRLVPAQYFRDPEPEEYAKYLESSAWLADVNNERKVKNATYAENLASLDNLVMVLFEEDLTVIPKESSWFAEVNRTDDSVTELRERKIYKEDWIGLKALDKKGGLVFEKMKGEHMQLNESDLKRLFGEYFGPMDSKTIVQAALEDLEAEWEMVEKEWNEIVDWVDDL